MTTREVSIKWWKTLSSDTKLNYWRDLQSRTFTPSHSPEELTGSEIESIWTNNIDSYLRDELTNKTKRLKELETLLKEKEDKLLLTQFFEHLAFSQYLSCDETKSKEIIENFYNTL